MRLAVVLILVAAGLAVGQWEPERRITATTGTSDQTARGNARAVTMVGNTVHVAYEERISSNNWVIHYTRSLDGGATWQFDSVISDSFADRIRYSPTISAGPTLVHVAWAHRDLSSPYSFVRYRRSINGGLNWEPRQTLNSVTAYDRYIDPSLAVNGSNLHLVYGDSGADSVFYLRSTDNGVNWQPGAMGYTIASDAVSPSVATNGSTVIVSYSGGPDANRDLYIRRSTDNGSNWQAPQLVDSRGTATTASCLLMRSSNAYIAYNGNPYGTSDVFLARSTNSGVSWSLGPAVDSGPGTQTDPSFNRSQNLACHVAYTDYSLAGGGVNYRNSVDEGATWSTPLRVDAGSGPATRPTVSVNGLDTVAVCWTDGRWSALYPDVYFRRNGPSLLDVACTRIVAPAGTIDSNQSVAPACSVTNYGTYAASFTVRCRVGGFYSDTARVTALQPGNSALVTFPAWAAWPRGVHVVACSTELAGDMVEANNKRTGLVTVRVLDAQALTILAPTGTIDSGTTIAPRATVRNNGTDPASFWVRLTIGTYVDSQNVSLGAGGGQTVTFANWSAGPRGTYAVRCSTRLTGDMAPPNNLATTSVTVRVLDAQAVSILAPTGTVDSGAIITPQAQVRNNGTADATFYTRLAIGPYVDSQQVTLTPGGTQTLNFAQWTATQRGVNAVRCSTKLTGDMVPANNLATTSVTVRVLDAQAVSILAPTGTVDSGAVITPQAQVRNNGTANANFYTRLVIGAYLDSQQVTLTPGGTQTLNFAQWTATQRGANAVRCSTRLTGDLVPANNLATTNVTVRVVDAQALSILAPTGTVDSGATVTPQAQVRNNGSENATFYTRLVIGAYVDSQQVTLTPGGTQTLNFAQWSAGPRGTYPVSCSTKLAADIVPANNRVAGSVGVAVHDAGIVAIAAPADTVPPGSVVPLATARNYGTDRPAARVWFSLNSSPAYRDSVILPAGLPFADTLLSFAAWNATTGNYQARCSVAMAGDQVPANNALGRSFTVASRNVDIGVTAILAPQGQYDTATPVIPQASFRNWGDVTTTFTALFRILDNGGAQVYANPVVISGLAGGRDTSATFAEWPLPHASGGYTTRCSVYVSGDVNPANDVATGSFTVAQSRATGWFEQTSVPVAPSGRAVKDGGWLACDAATGVIYVAKGYKTGDFYAYSPAADTWSQLATIPPGNEGKPPSKGAVGCATGRNVLYATKGNNSLGFYGYDIAVGSWLQLPDVPLGTTNKRVKGGTDLVYIEQADTGYVYTLKGYRNEFFRYNTVSGEWQALPDAPVGLRSRWDKGSWLAFDGNSTIYAHKARYHELWRYDVARDTWVGGMLASMPLESRLTGRRKRSKDGGSGAFWRDHLFALKGGNTQDFFRYSIPRDTWEEVDTMPIFGSTLRRKRVKAGADIVLAPAFDVFYALKGNKTRELWQYVPAIPAAALPPQTARDGVSGAARSVPGARFWVPALAVGSAELRWFGLPAEHGSTLSVYDAVGRAVLTRALDHSTTGSLLLSGLPAGVYLVRLESPGFTTTRKLIVQH
jgi:hypothetical protein